MHDRNQVNGFTLVELILVLIIVVTIVAFSVPKYVKLTVDARKSAVISIAGALGASNALNYSIRHSNTNEGIAISNCANLATLLAGGLPTNYVVTPAVVAPGTSVVCSLTDIPRSGEKVDASFYAFGVS